MDIAEQLTRILDAFPGENKRFVFERFPDGKTSASVRFEVAGEHRACSFQGSQWPKALLDRGRIEALALEEVRALQTMEFAGV